MLAISAGADAAPIQWTSGTGGNDHWYDFVLKGGLAAWHDARAAALASTNLGMSGYLATVTSAAENGFLTNVVSGSPQSAAASNHEMGKRFHTVRSDSRHERLEPESPALN